MRANSRERRVVVVDDSRTIQAILDNAFSKRSDFRVVGFASDAATAADIIRSLMPDVATIDLCMPYLDGEALLGMIGDLDHVCKIIVSDKFVHNRLLSARLLDAGASLCLSKTELVENADRFFQKINHAFDAMSGRRRLRTGSSAGPIGASSKSPAPTTPRVHAPYPVPVDERLRITLATKKNLFNAAREAQFDQITRSAAKLTGFPMALLTFIDQKTQWIKSSYGIEVESTPRDQAFCNYTISQEGVFTVSNAANDERFADNPLVLGAPNIRTYTGVPITTDDGVTLGALCIIDTRVRTVSKFSIDQLAALAEIVTTIIDLRPAIAA